MTRLGEGVFEKSRIRLVGFVDAQIRLLENLYPEGPKKRPKFAKFARIV